MLKKVTTLVLLFSFVLLTGCFTMNHVMGSGAAGGSVVQERQWYILWGLVPLNNVDSHAMAGGATNYTVKSQQSVVDVLINLVTGFVTVYSRTIEVRK